MSDGELVDVVDESDRVIAQVDRAEMRALGLRHRAVYVFVFHTDGRLFVHQRTRTKDLYPSHWDVCVSGVLRSGEGYDHAALRELREELGLAGARPRRLYPVRFESPANKVCGMAYRHEDPGPFLLQASEIQRGDWVEPDTIFRRAISEQFCPDSMSLFRDFMGRLAAGRLRE